MHNELFGTFTGTFIFKLDEKMHELRFMHPNFILSYNRYIDVLEQNKKVHLHFFFFYQILKRTE